MKKLLALITFSVLLLVTVGAQNAFAGAADVGPPILTVPPNIIINVGESIDPSNTGQATATDDQDPNPIIAFSDVADLDRCGRGTITRTWSATDANGNQSTGVQKITIVGSCPVGGELIPLETTMVLVAGTHSVAAWMIPVIVSAIGIGIVIARKF